MTYDARYQPPFRINARVRLNPNNAAAYPPWVRKQGPGIVGAHTSAKSTGVHRSMVHFDDGTEYPIRDEHLLGEDGEPPAVLDPAPVQPGEAWEIVYRRKPSRRGHGGSSGSPMSPDACPLGKDPRHCDAKTRVPWASDPRFYRCTHARCGHAGRFVERSAAPPAPFATREAR